MLSSPSLPKIVGDGFRGLADRKCRKFFKTVNILGQIFCLQFFWCPWEEPFVYTMGIFSFHVAIFGCIWSGTSADMPALLLACQNTFDSTHRDRCCKALRSACLLFASDYRTLNCIFKNFWILKFCLYFYN